jgi:hypothetical protein
MDRQYILEEIRRTAKANGDVALGRSRFSQETGIKEYDWSGKYWARWSDAIREAGLTPNAMQEAYDETLLIKKFILLIRELGRFPVHSELKLKAHNDVDFPSHNTFARLGVKRQRLAKIEAYCRTKAGYDDVIALCAIAAAAPDVPLSDSRGDLKDGGFGFVYLMKSGRYYKIGRTNATGRRERELTIQLPEKANTIHSIRTDDPPGIEAYWHNRFETKRKNGEWFDLTHLEVLAFKRRKFM